MNVKKWLDKGICYKGFIWNPSNCECECDKSCNVGEYLDYENCICRKKLFANWLKNIVKILMKMKWFLAIMKTYAIVLQYTLHYLSLLFK